MLLARERRFSKQPTGSASAGPASAGRAWSDPRPFRAACGAAQAWHALLTAPRLPPSCLLTYPAGRRDQWRTARRPGCSELPPAHERSTCRVQAARGGRAPRPSRSSRPAHPSPTPSRRSVRGSTGPTSRAAAGSAAARSPLAWTARQARSPCPGSRQTSRRASSGTSKIGATESGRSSKPAVRLGEPRSGGVPALGPCAQCCCAQHADRAHSLAVGRWQGCRHLFSFKRHGRVLPLRHTAFLLILLWGCLLRTTHCWSCMPWGT